VSIQLKVLERIVRLTGVTPSECKSVDFGDTQNLNVAPPFTLASYAVPLGKALLVYRVQSYAVYRAVPPGRANWSVLPNRVGVVAQAAWTSPLAASQLIIDTDTFYLFPPDVLIRLAYSPDNAVPAAGTWKIPTTCYGYLVPPLVADELGIEQNYAFPGFA
jgi:hypothetical protein